jgi:RHS repeat-associated protein
MTESPAQPQPPDRQPSPVPAITLPKGGGAVRGIGEKFAANPVTGTGSMTVPIATSPGRSGFGPQLSLSYDSGSGNGPFGFGWTLSLPAITRKTDKGLPQYQDAEDSDVFILSGAEDLVPVYRQDTDGTWVTRHPGYQRDPAESWVRDPSGRLVIHEDELDGYRVRRYRPRIEGLFARIERWSKIGAPGDVHWRSISKDNILTLYGLEADSRIADPLEPTRIFTWLICETRDDKGNAVVYRYKAEDGRGVDLDQAHERNRGPRGDVRRTANRYLKRIYYGNRTPLLDDSGARPRFLNRAEIDAQMADGAWMFEVVFDYGDHDGVTPKPNDDTTRDAAGLLTYSWKPRPDRFSSHRSGFEIRTTRLCQRVLMFHHFPGEAEVGRDCLVRSTDFTYSDEVDPTGVRNPVYAFLRAVTQTGYRRNSGGYDSRSLPPVEFEYTEPIVQDTVEHVDPKSLENLPIGLDGSLYRWTDLHGEGIPGILTEQAGAWFYKRNCSPIPVRLPDGSEVVKAKFSALETAALKPNVALGGGAEFMDLAGDGQPDVVVMEGPTPGLFEHDDGESWQPFRPFTSRLNRSLRHPNLKLVDLDGDGHADVLVTEDDAFVWHASLAEEGFGPARRVTQALDEEKGPRIVFADGTQSIYLADLSGDGLTDIVRIRNGEVCYWPNLGYGHFGVKVTMDNAPWFDQPDQFDQERIRLADIDGSGTADIIYLHRDGVRLYFNQSGNSWSKPQLLRAYPRIDDVVSIVPTDLLGNGTVCLVWSSPLHGDARRQMRYVNLMGGRKPHLLVKTTNSLGAETRVDYAPSTKFYLQDKRAGKPWISRLPFPVHVVERVKTYDHISRNRFVTRYAYHHGHFDGDEREFRGFGMVEQWDTEELAALTATGIPPAGGNEAGESHVPPVHTKTWFHTGVHLGRQHVSDYFAGLLSDTDPGEYFREPCLTDAEARALLLPDTILPAGLTPDEECEACRALKGSMLRQEVYADDAGPDADADRIRRSRVPYTVTEQNFTVHTMQARGANRHAVFLVHPWEALSYHYERNPADPRVQHALTLEVDVYGNVLKRAAVGYGRRGQIRVVSALGQVQEVPNPGLASLAVADRAKQTTTLLTYTENRVTNAVNARDAYRTPVPCETLTFELTGYPATGPAGRFQAADLVKPDPGAAGGVRHRFTDEVAYEAAPTGSPCRRPVDRTRTLYRSDDLTTLLPLGQVQPLALPGESYALAFTPSLLTDVFQRPHAGRPAEPLLPDPAAVLGGRAGDQGGYCRSQTLKADDRFPAGDPDDHWWIPSGRSFFTTDPTDDATTEFAQARRHFFLSRRTRDPFGQDTAVDYDANDLLTVETRDALGNRVTVDGNDYRVLQPRLVSDPNRNRAEVAFDTLGLVVGTAVMGKPTPAPAEGDTLTGFLADLTQAQLDGCFDAADPHASAPALLQGATTRIVYDLDRFRRTLQANPTDPTAWQPAGVATLAREAHVNAPPPASGLKIQLSFSYSDGFGREIQKKIQAEPGPVLEGGALVNPRWVGSGWTVFNNKAKPVRRYEPFFSTTHGFEFANVVGVSPVLCYDPIGRVVLTLHPGHSYDKVVFDAWRQENWDVNDTILKDNPAEDKDVDSYFRRLAAVEYLPTWYSRRRDGALGAHEQTAAEKAAVHDETPSVTYIDSLARVFLTVAHNRFVEANGVTTRTVNEKHETRVELDIEGNQRTVIDARGRIVARYVYDIAGRRIYESSMDSGERWMLGDATDLPLYAWDSLRRRLHIRRDKLRRPIEELVSTAGGAERLAQRLTYGESAAGAAAANQRGRAVEVCDPAGRLTSDAYDFKGNLLSSTRTLATTYTTELNWKLAVPLEPSEYTSRTEYDALNRPTVVSGPRGNLTTFTYNQAGLLQSIEAFLRGAPTATTFVRNIGYDAKGRRTLIEYGNGVSTTYVYDPLTFRLVHLLTTGMDDLQDLSYVYDPIGNITHIEDSAQQTIFFDNHRVTPSTDYTYDAVYRLVEATGREQLGQGAGHEILPVVSAHPRDGNSMGRYVERYSYDLADNIDRVVHEGTNPAVSGWTRRYIYNAPSPLEAGVTGNQLTGTRIGSGPTLTYGHDKHGNMTAMPHLPLIRRNYRDQLQATARQVITDGIPEITNYVYDTSGERVRKVTDSEVTAERVTAGKAPVRRSERIYLGVLEVYREYDSSGTSVTLERETLHMMDGMQRVALVETKIIENGAAVVKPKLVQRYQLGDHLGSAVLEMDSAGKVVSYEEYHPYGTTAYVAGPNATEVSLKRYRYTGRERDKESGFSYYGARYYSPWLGRWTEADPAGEIDGPNRYAYAKCSPTTATDPSGLATKKVGPTLGEKGEQHFGKRLEARGTKFTPQVESATALSKTDFLKLKGPDVELKTRNLANWRLASGKLDRTAIRRLETEKILQNAKHVLDTGEKESMLYQLLNATGSEVEDYKGILRQLRSELAQDLASAKKLEPELAKLVKNTTFSRKQLASVLADKQIGLGVTTWERVTESTKAVTAAKAATKPAAVEAEEKVLTGAVAAEKEAAHAEAPPSPLSEYSDIHQTATEASVEGGTTLANPVTKLWTGSAGALAGPQAPGTSKPAEQQRSPRGNAPAPEPDSIWNLWGLLRRSPAEAPVKRPPTDQEVLHKWLQDQRTAY